mmetsp:Transcript_81846/g.240265  ORF Transcript_81846/g.240265 Transcript_81846/m.240265 type:complete len:223 (+) Transcript_81846:467-1135(+)
MPPAAFAAQSPPGYAAPGYVALGPQPFPLPPPSSPMVKAIVEATPAGTLDEAQLAGALEEAQLVVLFTAVMDLPFRPPLPEDGCWSGGTPSVRISTGSPNSRPSSARPWAMGQASPCSQQAGWCIQKGQSCFGIDSGENSLGPCSALGQIEAEAAASSSPSAASAPASSSSAASSGTSVSAPSAQPASASAASSAPSSSSSGAGPAASAKAAAAAWGSSSSM